MAGPSHKDKLTSKTICVSVNEVETSQRRLPMSASAATQTYIYVDIHLHTHPPIHVSMRTHMHVRHTYGTQKHSRCPAQGLPHTPCPCRSPRFTERKGGQRCSVLQAFSCWQTWIHQSVSKASHYLSSLLPPLPVSTIALSQEHRCCPRQGTIRQKVSRAWAF